MYRTSKGYGDHRKKSQDLEEMLEKTRLSDFLNAFIRELKPKLNKQIVSMRAIIYLIDSLLLPFLLSQLSYCFHVNIMSFWSASHWHFCN